MRVRMYQVGFGDCFLLSFEYDTGLADGRSERHVLIDFGSRRAPKGLGTGLRARVAQLIEQHTQGHLDVIVATHRHKDHIDGFGDAHATEILDRLQPGFVVRPWMDDPKLPPDASGPALRSGTRRFAASLGEGQTFAATVAELASEAPARSVRARVARLALDQLPNQDALEWLTDRTKTEGGVYVSAGNASGIEEFVPGITVRVLGPPTVDQEPDLVHERANDPEFWLALHRQLEQPAPAGIRGDGDEHVRAGAPSAGGRLLTAGQSVPVAEAGPGPVGWLVDRLDRQQLGSLMRIVRTLDDALNNTSVILLIDAGDKRMLFPGDAQIENWLWALKDAPEQAELTGLLADVDLYKVGHHGSRNATPRSLFKLWGEDPDPARPMTALMSTLSHVFGESEATFVPRATLVAALGRRTNLVTTDGLAAAQPFVEVVASTSDNQPFAVVPTH